MTEQQNLRAGDDRAGADMAHSTRTLPLPTQRAAPTGRGRGRAALCSIALLGAGLISACGREDGTTEADLRAALVDAGFTPAEARCYVGELYDEWSEADREAVERLDQEYNDFDVDVDRVNEVDEKCLEGGAEFEEVGESIGSWEADD